MFNLLRIVKAACAAQCKPNELILVKKIKKYIYTSFIVRYSSKAYAV